MDCIEAQPTRDGSFFVFPADWGDGHLFGVVRVLDYICRKTKPVGVTPHVLQHTFASVAGDLGFSELAIAGLLSHSAHGVTQATCTGIRPWSSSPTEFPWRLQRCLDTSADREAREHRLRAPCLCSRPTPRHSHPKSLNSQSSGSISLIGKLERSHSLQAGRQ